MARRSGLLQSIASGFASSESIPANTLQPNLKTPSLDEMFNIEKKKREEKKREQTFSFLFSNI